MSDVIRQQIVLLLPRLRRFCLGLTASRDLADDLVQATCERALARLHQWQPDTRLDSWMFTIAKTVWINDWHRRQTRGVEVELDDMDASQSADSEKATESSILLKRVLEQMKRLPEEQQELLLLVCVEGFSYRETAEILDIKVGTVMSRLARARQKIRELMTESPAAAQTAMDGEPDHA